MLLLLPPTSSHHTDGGSKWSNLIDKLAQVITLTTVVG